jgi:hypothetical protein
MLHSLQTGNELPHNRDAFKAALDRFREKKDYPPPPEMKGKAPSGILYLLSKRELVGVGKNGILHWTPLAKRCRFQD